MSTDGRINPAMVRPDTEEARLMFAEYYSEDDARAAIGYSFGERPARVEDQAREPLARALAES